MTESILTKEEYTAKLDNLFKPVIELAINTDKFKDTGAYEKEYVIDDQKRITVMVVDNQWITVKFQSYYDMLFSRSKCHSLERENEELKEELEKYQRREKFFKIFKRKTYES